ncbi:MAG: L-threonylcarbamoyladenylate synthase [Nitrospiria bacterium]
MKKIIPVDPVDPDPRVLSYLSEVIRKGGIVAFPTDTFYGLAVNPFDQDAVARLFKIKGRDRSKPVLLLIASADMLRPLVEEIPPLAEKAIKRFWPGPLTLVFKGTEHLPGLLMGGTGKIGIRLPDAKVAIRLIKKVGLPLTATSANRSGASSPMSASDVEAALGSDIDHILDDGETRSPIPSTVLDVTKPHLEILREGRIPIKMLRECISVGGKEDG